MKNTQNSDNSFTVKTPIFIESEKTILQRQYRCKDCNKLLGIENLHLPSFEIKCHRCGRINEVLNNYTQQIIITDKNGIILYVNEEVEKATGYSVAEIVGKTPAVWGNQMSQEVYKKMWREIKNEKKAVIVNITNKAKDGHLYDVVLRISPILDADGEIELFIGRETTVKEYTP